MIDKIKELEHKLEIASDRYYNSEAIMSDEEYDALRDQLSELDPNNHAVISVGAEPTSEWPKDRHWVQLGSLNKSHTIEDVSKWIKESSDDDNIFVCAKVDGISIGLQYKSGVFDKGILRGAGNLYGENITPNVLKMRGLQKKLPTNFTGTIRGEIVLLKHDYKKYFSDKKNPRNAASGISRRSDGSGCENLTILCYQVLGDIKFKTEIDQLYFLEKHLFVTPIYKLFSSVKELHEYYLHFQNEIRNNISYEVDGLVLSVNNIPHQEELGETNLRPKGKKAFKFAKQMVPTTVKSIEWICGSMGSITPVCHVEKVNILGSDVSKASLYNIAYIEKLGIGVGAEVLLCKAGEIIPRIEKVTKPAPNNDIEQLPTFCPSCCGEVEMDGEKLCCISSDICPSQIEGRILNWIKSVAILEWGDKLITKLVETGKVYDIVDLYKLSVDDLSNIDRMGTKSAVKCHQSLWSHNPIPLDIFLGSLSIPLVATATIKKIIDAGYSTVESIFGLSIDDLVKVKGLGPAKSKQVFSGLKRNKSIIDGLLEQGVAILEPGTVDSKKLLGYRICITGSTHNKRDHLKKMITDNSGEYKNKVSKDCTHLIIADINSTSSKAIDAKKLGITLISESDFLDLIIK